MPHSFTRVTLLFPALSLFAAPAPGSPASREAEETACREFNRKLENVSLLDSTQTGYRDTKTALAALELLEQGRGSSPRFLSAVERVAERGPRATDEDYDELWKASRCGHVVPYYTHFKRLIDSARSLGFSNEQKARITRASLGHIDQSTRSPNTFLAIAASLTLAQALVEQGWIALPEARQEALKTLRQESETLREKLIQQARTEYPTEVLKSGSFHDLKPKARAAFRREVAAELAATEPVRRRLREALASLENFPASPASGRRK